MVTRTRRTRPTGPEQSLGGRELLAWLVLDAGTGSVLGKIGQIRNSAGLTAYWRAYAIDEAAYGAPSNPPVWLGDWDLCQDAQDTIARWHDEQAREVTS